MGNWARIGTGLVAAFLLCGASCDPPKNKLPKAPAGTWWDARDPQNDGAYLMADNGVRIGAFEGNQAWLFECGNQSLIFQTREQAVQAVVLCGSQGSTATWRYQ